MSADSAVEAPRVESRSATAARAPHLAPVRGRRRPWLIALGVLLAAVGGLTVVWLVGAAGQRIEVVVVRQEVPYGQAIRAEDLGLARVSVDPGVAIVPAADRSGVVGQYAATHLQPGMLLSVDMASVEGGPAPGRVLVPVALAAERMPAGGLRAGDPITVVDAGDTSTAGAAARTFAGIVERVGATDVNGVTVVDVTTALGDGPGLAVASANGRVAVVLQANRG